jgi:hypothetical protein
MSLRRKFAYLAVANALVLLVAALAVEIAGRLFLLARPSYEVVFLQPDRAVGWRGVPNLRWTWAGTDWYARDFSVRVETNSHGFRDLERPLAKPAGTIRVALLGDSFVEAIQVPFEKTAGHLLERRLNAGRGAASRAARGYEVLNFGISNHGVGQYLLTWEAYAGKFEPDFVFALVAGLHITRTVQRYETGAFRATAGRWLWVRPTFRLRDGSLVREPAKDFDEFVRVQERLITEELRGRRTRRRESSLIAHYAKELWSAYARREGSRPPSAPPPMDPGPRPAETLAINLAVLRELGGRVRSDGGLFGIVDSVRYFNARGSQLSEALAGLCAEGGFGYVPLGERLLEAERDGRRTRWAHDSHFNEAGNEIFADSLYEWITAHGGG